jgi:hypothetical protein
MWKANWLPLWGLSRWGWLSTWSRVRCDATTRSSSVWLPHMYLHHQNPLTLKKLEAKIPSEHYLDSRLFLTIIYPLGLLPSVLRMCLVISNWKHEKGYEFRDNLTDEAPTRGHTSCIAYLPLYTNFPNCKDCICNGWSVDHRHATSYVLGVSRTYYWMPDSGSFHNPKYIALIKDAPKHLRQVSCSTNIQSIVTHLRQDIVKCCPWSKLCLALRCVAMLTKATR